MIGYALLGAFLWDHFFRFIMGMPATASAIGAFAMPLAAVYAARSRNLSWESIGRWALVALGAELLGHWYITGGPPNFVWVVVLAAAAQRWPLMRWFAWIPAVYCGYGVAGYAIARSAHTRELGSMAFALIATAIFQGPWYALCAAIVLFIAKIPDSVRLQKGLVGAVYAGHFLPIAVLRWLT